MHTHFTQKKHNNKIKIKGYIRKTFFLKILIQINIKPMSMKDCIGFREEFFFKHHIKNSKTN